MSARTFLTLCLIGSSVFASVPAQGVTPETILATTDDGPIRIADLRARVWLTDYPVSWVLDVLEAESIPEARREEALGELEALVREAAASMLLAEHLSGEEWARGPAFEHRVNRLIADPLRRLWAADASDRVEPMGEEELERCVETRLANRPDLPESRRARVIVLVPESDEERDSLRALAERLREEALATPGAFALLATEHSEGPGRETGGLLPEGTRDRAPWPALGEAIFQAPQGEPIIHEDENAITVIRVERVLSPSPLGREEIAQICQQSWIRARTPEVMAADLESWRQSAEITRSEMQMDHEAVVLSVDGREFTLGDIVAIHSNWQPARHEEVIGETLNTELLVRRLDTFFDSEEAAQIRRVARHLTVERLWHDRLLRAAEISEEAIQERYEFALERGAYHTYPEKHLLLCRVMPRRPDEPVTAESLALWPRVDETAEAARRRLAGHATSPEAFAAEVEAMDAESPLAIEFLDMGALREPPRLLGLAFWELEAGDLSEIVAPRENVRLIYAVADARAREPMPLSQVRSQVVSVLRRHAMAAEAQRVTDRLLGERGFTSRATALIDLLEDE